MSIQVVCDGCQALGTVCGDNLEAYDTAERAGWLIEDVDLCPGCYEAWKARRRAR